MTDVKGTKSRNTSKGFDFYISYSVTDEPANLRLKVTASAWFYIGNWGFAGAEAGSVTIDIGGSSKKVSWSTLNCADHYTWYKIGEHTAYYAYKTSDTSVKATATTTDIYCSGYGPGKCSATATFTVNTKCSTAGSLSVTIGGEDSATWKLTGLKSTTAYKRNVVFYIKPASSSSWINCGSQAIAANAAAGTPTFTKAGLIPGTAYNFACDVYASKSSSLNAIYLFTKSGSGTTSAAAGALSLSNVTVNSLTATVTGMKSTTANARSVKFSYRKSGASSWTLATTRTIAANAAAGSPSNTFTGLVPGNTYEIQAQLLTGSTVVKTLTGSRALPYAGVSVPTMLRAEDVKIVYDDPEEPAPSFYYHTVKPPNPTICLIWMVDTYDYDAESYATTQFKTYLQHGSEKVLVETVVGSSVQPSQIEYLDNGVIRTKTVRWHMVSYDASSWLGEKETVKVWVEAYNPNAAGTAKSNELVLEVTDRFYWDTDKVAGEAFGITAMEWNRLEDYLQAAYGLYPEHFDEHTAQHVQIYDQFTVAIANAAGYAPPEREAQTLLDAEYPTTASLRSIYVNGFYAHTSDRAETVVSAAVSGSVNGRPFASAIDAEVRIREQDGKKIIFVPAGQEIFAYNPAAARVLIKMTAVYTTGATAMQEGDPVTAVDAMDFESRLHVKMHEATGH